MTISFYSQLLKRRGNKKEILSLLHIGADLDPSSEIRQKLYLSNLYEWPKTDDVGDSEATEIVWYIS